MTGMTINISDDRNTLTTFFIITLVYFTALKFASLFPSPTKEKTFKLESLELTKENITLKMRNDGKVICPQ
jgi:hypothetical protein